MADDDGPISQQRVAELKEAIDLVRNPFERAELEHRLQVLTRPYKTNQIAHGREHDTLEQLYKDVAAALGQTPRSKGSLRQKFARGPSTTRRTEETNERPFLDHPYPIDAYEAEMERRERLEQQQQESPAATPNRPRLPLLAPDRTIRGQNISYASGTSSTGVAAPVSARSYEDARYQMANLRREWDGIGSHASYWNKMKAESGLGNQNNKRYNNNNNDSANAFGPPSYTPATRRTTGAAASSAPGRINAARDSRVFRAKPSRAPKPAYNTNAAARSSRLPDPHAPPEPMAQNLQQLANYVRRRAQQQQRGQGQQGRRSPSAQTLQTMRDADNDVIMRDLISRRNQFGKRYR